MAVYKLLVMILTLSLTAATSKEIIRIGYLTGSQTLTDSFYSKPG